MFKLSVAFVTLVLFQSVFAAPVLLTAGNNNNAAAGVANRHDGPGRINGVSVTRRQNSNGIDQLLDEPFPGQEDGGVGDVLSAVSLRQANDDEEDAEDADDAMPRRQILPGGSDSAGVGSVLSGPLGSLLGPLLGEAAQADALGADTAQRKRNARSVAGGFLDNIPGSVAGATKGSDSESAQRRQSGPGNPNSATGTVSNVLGDSDLDDGTDDVADLLEPRSSGSLLPPPFKPSANL